MVLAAALVCLSLNIYHESRKQPLAGQHAVAQVTWNRAGHDADRVCTVVTKDRGMKKVAVIGQHIFYKFG
jgi:spore germination cell wall hydrolase CwlJ-like protein